MARLLEDLQGDIADVYVISQTMLGIVSRSFTMAALEEYHECIAKLCRDFPECWSLVMKAEDRCRGEHFERIRRSLIRARLEGRLPMNLSFDPDQPWPGVFTFAARDEAYWTAEVIRPCTKLPHTRGCWATHVKQ